MGHPISSWAMTQPTNQDKIYALGHSILLHNHYAAPRLASPNLELMSNLRQASMTGYRGDFLCSACKIVAVTAHFGLTINKEGALMLLDGDFN